MSLFGSLSVGTSGLKVSQYGLNVVAHNLANVETEGYVRQQTVFDTAGVNKIGGNAISSFQVGLGVDPQTVRQVRDFFLDKAYRNEVGRESYYDSQSAAVDEIEQLFGELQGVAFQSTMTDLWVSMQELSKDPDNRVTQATFIESGVSFLERATDIYKELNSYQHDLNAQIKDQINRINEIGDQIHELNIKIANYEADGREHANDLRDERNNLLDELSGIVKTDYTELENGQVTVSVEDITFVNENQCFKMGALTVAEYRDIHNIDDPLDEGADLLMAVWPHLGGADVFDWSEVPSATANSDIGGLKGAIQARGDKIGKYIDIPIEPVKEDYGTDEDAYKAALEKYNADTREYNLTTEASIVRRTQSQFDQLIHGIITTINDVLCPNKYPDLEGKTATAVTFADGTTRTIPEGVKLQVFDAENAPIGQDKDATAGTEVFKRKTVDRYEAKQDVIVTLDDGSTAKLKGVQIYNWEDPNDNYSLYTLGETEVNQALLSNKSKLPILSPDRTGDFDITMVQKLMQKWQDPFATLSPNTLTMNNFMNYYTQFTGAIATKGDEFSTLADNQRAMVESIEDKRTGLHGVSSDEELTNLIKFQHAYNASARYINVIDQMLQHVIERLG
jgi:flagellar hook-associated protein 1 FlgK